MEANSSGSSKTRPIAAATRAGNGSGETELGRLVVERNLATLEELNAVLAEQKRLAEADAKPLGDLLVEKGVLTPRQLQRIRQSLEEIRPAQQIPGYQILAKLGAGAMATVYKARQLSLDRLVAVKVLSRRYSENKEYVDRFYKEGQAAAKLNHANIVQAIDVGESGGFYYFVMEYVEGYTLYDELAKGKVYSEAEALRIIIQIAKALQHAHERGLIHRDVKPKNIMMTNDGVAKLADMGLARLAADEQAAQAEAGRAFGTPYYISPEQIRGELNINFQADIYSLGATLYHLITGRVPFEGPTPAAVMHKHLKEPLVPPDHINTTLSVGIGEMVEAMMAKRRDERYGSTKDLLIDLEAVARGEPPIMVHKALDAKSLSALNADDQPSLSDTADMNSSAASAWPAWLVYVLMALLGVSLIINIVLAALR